MGTRQIRRRAGKELLTRRELVVAEAEFAEVIHDALVRAVLFVDLQDTGVLGVAGRENTRGFSGQKDAGVGAVAINETSYNKHGD